MKNDNLETVANRLIRRMDQTCKKIKLVSEKDRWYFIKKINSLEDEFKKYRNETNYEQSKTKISKAANFYRKSILEQCKTWEKGANQFQGTSFHRSRFGFRVPDEIHGRPILNSIYRRFRN